MIPKRTLPIDGSSSVPRKYRKYMLNARCSRLACRKPDVIRRYHSPSATNGPKSTYFV